MEDGARAHIYTPVRDYVNNIFSGRVIAEHFIAHPWPARSPDLTPCDFFLWGWVKDAVYKHLPLADTASLKTAVKDVIDSLPEAYCVRACRSVLKRLVKLIEVQ